MLHKAGESEEATPLCFKDCALEIGLDRTRFQIIFMNAYPATSAARIAVRWRTGGICRAVGLA
jgi:hypothetical protein